MEEVGPPRYRHQQFLSLGFRVLSFELSEGLLFLLTGEKDIGCLEAKQVRFWVLAGRPAWPDLLFNPIARG